MAEQLKIMKKAEREQRRLINEQKRQEKFENEPTTVNESNGKSHEKVEKLAKVKSGIQILQNLKPGTSKSKF